MVRNQIFPREQHTRIPSKTKVYKKNTIKVRYSDPLEEQTEKESEGKGGEITVGHHSGVRQVIQQKGRPKEWLLG